MDTQASMAGKLTWKGEQGEEKDEESEQLHSRGRRGLQNKTRQLIFTLALCVSVNM